ncbi:hypothetical protein [Kribbella sp. NPDC048928]
MATSVPYRWTVVVTPARGDEDMPETSAIGHGSAGRAARTLTCKR